MKFTVSGGVGVGGARLGALVTEAGARLETPRAALLTSAGAVPHVTRSVLDRLAPGPQLLLAPLSSCMHLVPGARANAQGIAAFCASRPQDAWLVTPDDASVETPEGHFHSDSVPLWTRHGKALVDPDRYMKVMEVFRPDAFCVLADTRAHPGAGRKRITRAAARCTTFLAACLEHNNTHSSILGVITGWGCEEALSRTVEAVKRATRLCGVVLAGLCSPSAAPYTPPSDLPVQLTSVLEGLGGELFRVVPGRWSPAVAVSLVAAGCDVLDSSVATRLADTGHAIVFPLRPTDNGTDAILHLDDERYVCDLTPLVPGCACVACTSHTRAYIHHLRRTRELLAPLLLTLHNLHHYDAMFAEIRSSLAAGTFSQYRQHIVDQHPRWLAQHPELANTDKSTDMSTDTSTDKRKRLRADTPTRSTPDSTHAV